MVPADQVADLRKLPAVNSFLESHGHTAGRRVFVKLVGGSTGSGAAWPSCG